MNIQLSPGNVTNYGNNLPTHNQQKIIYYFNVQQTDEPTQLVQLCEESPTLVYNTDSSKSSTKRVTNGVLTETTRIQPLGSCENPIEIIRDGAHIHSTQNLSQDHLRQIAQALQFETIPTNENVQINSIYNEPTNIIYQVVYPEELDLKYNTKAGKRGRPKKRLLEQKVEKIEVVKEPIVLKSVRTRSGRITRPPQHIKKHFKRIETSELDHLDPEIKIVDFEPLKTNRGSKKPPEKSHKVESIRHKRPIGAQVRCRKCNKAYLGRRKIMKHLEEFPDHGPLPDRYQIKYDDGWNYLINISKENPDGKKATRFFEELTTIIKNLRNLAKTVFQSPSSMHEKMYFVDDYLSTILGISMGHYCLNEDELFKDTSDADLKNKKVDESSHPKNVQFRSADKVCENSLFDMNVFTGESKNNNEMQDYGANAGSGMKGGTKLNEKVVNILNNENRKSNSLSSNLSFEQNSFDLNTDEFINCSSLSDKQFGDNLQTDQILNNFNVKNVRKSTSISSDLSLSSELLSDNLLLNSLPNLRTSVDDLMLNNVDSGPNLLDNSASSDEVMNVDQFVNERFKNLTESVLELPNNSLNLDLQSLDLFQFNTS